MFFCTLSSNDFRVYKVSSRMRRSTYLIASIYCLGSLMFIVAFTFLPRNVDKCAEVRGADVFMETRMLF